MDCFGNILIVKHNSERNWSILGKQCCHMKYKYKKEEEKNSNWLFNYSRSYLRIWMKRLSSLVNNKGVKNGIQKIIQPPINPKTIQQKNFGLSLSLLCLWNKDEVILCHCYKHKLTLALNPFLFHQFFCAHNRLSKLPYFCVTYIFLSYLFDTI